VSARARPGGGAPGHRARGARPPTEVAFRVAASPRIGFGHLVRAIHLSKALGVPPRVSIRGTKGAAETARGLGADVLPAARDAVVHRNLRLLIIDDPSRAAATPWLRAARRAGVPVASLHDVGIAPLASDLAVDGSLGAVRVHGLGVDAGACRLGPAYAVLEPGLRRPRRPGGRAPSEPRTILVGLGGGEQARAGWSIARHLRAELERLPGLSRVRVLLSLGLDPSGGPGAAARLAGIDVVPPARFRAALARAAVAVVAGGITLYEACALGTPVVAVPVVPGQATTVRRFVRAGLAAGLRTTGGVGTDAWGRAAAGAALALLADPSRRRDLARRGRLAIDGRGAARVAHALSALRSARARAKTTNERKRKRSTA
jgi:spore coat polysaccharide biosynthesis predicted glycosyltransferase SpsG